MADLKTPTGATQAEKSTSRPFFSIIIPTVNRPDFLEATLKSALWQTFKNYEVIVSDSSDNDETQKRIRKIIQKEADSSRLRCIRPGRWMNMPDHLEFASGYATGTYVLFMTHRRVMRPGALEYLFSKIKTAPPGIGLVSWYDHWGYSDLSGIVNGGPFSGETKLIQSKELVKDFATFEQWKEGGYWGQQLPHTFNSCYLSNLGEEVRKNYNRIFFPVSPDFMAGFLMLAHTPEVLYLDSPLYLQHSGKFVGNGTVSFVEGVEKFTSTFPEIDPFEGVPIRLNTLFNTLARDILRAKEMVGNKYSDIQPNWVGYYVSNYLEIMDKEQVGSGMDILNLYSLWEEGVTRLSAEQQLQVREILKGFQKRRASFILLRRLVRKMGLAPYYSIVIGKIRNLRHRITGEACLFLCF